MTALAVFLIFWVGGVLIQKVVRRLGLNKDLDKQFLGLMSKSAKLGIIIIGAITAAGTLGIDVSALVAGLGLTGFALGFAFRDMLSNLIAGTMILIYRPFQVNDRIAVAGSEGQVSEISLRYTTILTESGKVRIPNATLYKNAVTVFNPTNKTGNGDRNKGHE